MDNGIFDKAREVLGARELASDLDTRAKEAKAHKKELEQELADMMIAEELQSFNLDGRLFYLTTRTYASAPAEHREELHEWLREHGHGDLIKEVVNSQTLSAFIRELDEDDGIPESLAELITMYAETSVGVRKGG